MSHQRPTNSPYIGKGGLRGKYKENWVSDPLRNTIVDALNARNMNIADLARAVGAPGSSVVSRWMMRARPSVESLQAIADALDLDVFDLLYKAEYINRLPSNGVTNDPVKRKLVQKLIDLEMTAERAVMLESLLDTMLSQKPRPVPSATPDG